MPADRPEVEAIQDAYRDYLKGLFKTLVHGLVTHESEEQSLEMFRTGLGMAGRARQMAMAVVDPGPTVATVRPRRTKARPK
jgi:hypothetical protein